MPGLVISERLTPASAIRENWGWNCVIYGLPGAGKTTLACTAPKVLLIDIEAGARSIADRKDVTVFRPTKWTELNEIYQYLLTSDHNFKTVVVDSITEAQRMGLDTIMLSSKTPDMPGIGDYGKSNEQMTRMLRAFKGLASGKGFNIVFTALEVEDKDQLSGAIQVRPALTPRVASGVCGAVDIIGHLEVEMGGKRVLQLDQTPSVMAKVRQPFGRRTVPARVENPDLSSLIKLAAQTADGQHVEHERNLKIEPL